MKIYDLINELQEEVDNAKPFIFGRKKIDAELVGEILADIRNNLPKEITRAQAILAEEQAILQRAKDKAQIMLEGVDERVAQMIEDNKITQLAYEKSNRLIDIANRQALELKNGANEYAIEIFDDIMSYLKEYVAMVSENRRHFVFEQNITDEQSTFDSYYGDSYYNENSEEDNEEETR